MKSGMLTANERKRMLDIGARYVEEGAPHSWFIEAYEEDEGDVDAVYSNLVEEGLLRQIGPGNVFHITATGRDWVKAHSADLMKQPLRPSLEPTPELRFQDYTIGITDDPLPVAQNRSDVLQKIRNRLRKLCARPGDGCGS